MSNNTNDPITRLLGGEKNYFLLVFLGVTGVLFLGSYWVITIAVGLTRVDDAASPAYERESPIYVSYAVEVDEYVSGASYLAMGDYQAQFPMPQNVEVLQGLTTQEINGYMLNYFVAGLHVNCTYCHNLNNFAAYEDDEAPLPTEEGAAPHPNWSANKRNARTHLTMTQDLNRNWLTQLDGLTDEKKPSNSQIVCATCHNGVARPITYLADQTVLPDDFRLPLDEQYDLTAENQGILNVNARRDISLDTVNYQQNVMYHMNQSMNVGCTHCHNSRYFPSREVPPVHYAQNMLQMTQYLWLNYQELEDASEEDGTRTVQMPSCNQCHQGNIIPPAAVISPAIMPAALVPQDETTIGQYDE